MKKIPYVTEEDVSRWEATIEKSLPILIQSIELGNTQSGRRYYQLYKEYRSQACMYYVRNDISKARDALLNSAKSFAILLDKYKHGEDVKPGFISYTDYQAMFFALICGDISLAKRIANNFEKDESFVTEHDFFEEVAEAIRYAILGQKEVAVSHSLNAVDIGFENLNNFAKLLSEVVGNKSVSVDLLEECLKEFDKSVRVDSVGIPEASIFLDGLGVMGLSVLLNANEVTLEIDDQRLDIELMQISQ